VAQGSAEKPSYLVDLGHNVRRRRKAQKLTVKTLAMQAGISASTLERIERADRSEPSVGKVLALKGALQSNSIDELISPEGPDRADLDAPTSGVEARRQEYFDFLLSRARSRAAMGEESPDILDRIDRLLELDAEE
jgi:transcriptional regulator with XRE-family HTH domain